MSIRRLSSFKLGRNNPAELNFRETDLTLPDDITSAGDGRSRRGRYAISRPLQEHVHGWASLEKGNYRFRLPAKLQFADP